jgi:hypothetical protein
MLVSIAHSGHSRVIYVTDTDDEATDRAVGTCGDGVTNEVIASGTV